MSEGRPVAVVMTVWNTPGQWVTEALDSVRAQMRPGIELVTVNDGSDRPDTLAALGGGSGIAARTGIGTASNRGIALTDAPLIARLDADDRMMPDTLRVLSEYLDTHPMVDVVSGAMHYIRPDGSRFGKVSPPVMHGSPRHQGRIVHSGCMFRREIWEHVGGYPDMRAADWHFWERCEAAGARFSVLPHFVIERRVHPDSFSFAKSKHLQRWWEKAQ